MKIAIISDIHGNLEAFTATLQALVAEKPDVLHCLGDIVGYGANPRECLSAVMALFGERGVIPPAEISEPVAQLGDVAGALVAGNHDWAVGGRLDDSWFNEIAQKAVRWTVRQLDGNERDYLASLPLTISQGDILFVHSSPRRPEEFGYIMNYSEAEEALRHTDARLIFIGHVHSPGAFLFGAPRLGRQTARTPLVIPTSARAVVNAGSIGQPRDGDPRACYITYETETGELVIHRVEYDYARAAEKIEQAGLPSELAQRLFVGY
jgi:diadenosine tetraphosphatase ApaH/serine/threonine PP2A family protein phosphatase